jgi:hypothetical protein
MGPGWRPGQSGIAPGSGNHWADGIGLSDWSSYRGSQIFRDGLASGLISMGSNLYGYQHGRLTRVSEAGGRLGFWEKYTWLDFTNENASAGGEQLAAVGIGMRFKAFAKQQQTQGRPTFAGGVMYSDIAQGLKDIWAASQGANGHAPYLENAAVFTDQGLLVLPNIGNGSGHILGSLKFLNQIINKEQTAITYKGKTLKILGFVHTHPDPSKLDGHSPPKELSLDPGDYLFKDTKVGSFVISTGGLYRAEYNYTSCPLGPLSDQIIRREILKNYPWQR